VTTKATRLSLSLLVSGLFYGALVMPAGPSVQAQEEHPVAAAAAVARRQPGGADPAIWLDPLDPSRSTFIGQRGGSAGVFDLPGNSIQSLRQASLQVDLRGDFVLDGRAETIASLVGAPRGLRFCRRSRIAGARAARDVERPPRAVVTSCLYEPDHPTTTSSLSAAGAVTQLRLTPPGRLDLPPSGHSTSARAAACVADDALGSCTSPPGDGS
jgi:hypothetical protein